MSDAIDINISNANFEVYWQDEVELNLDMALMYIKSGEVEIQNYVDNVSKPEISNYVETEAKPLVTQIVNEIAEPTVAEYIENTVKPEIDEYVEDKKPELQAYVTQASGYAENSQTSATASATSASAALTSANNAKTSETNAKTYENNALNSKNAAASSATSSSNYANNSKIWAEGTDSQVQALGGTHSAKGWAEASTNLDYTNITNCITAIPQDIKLELNNGTLTLKAGSKVYKGNGTAINITSDKTITYNQNYPCVIWYDPTISSLRIFPQQLCFSGNTVPTFSGNYALWFDTVNKDMKFTGNGGSSWTGGQSLPIAIVTVSGGAITSIDQVFNGFGYIGNTIFTWSGVEGLIPLGKNVNGSLNNKKQISVMSVKTFSGAITNGIFAIDGNGILQTGNTLVYDSNKNLNYLNGTNLAYWCNCGTFSANSTGRITSFNPKTVFQATDYYDFKQLDDSAAKLDKNNTFIGTNNTFSTNMIVKNTSQAWDNNLSGTTRFGQVVFQDNTGYGVSYIRPTGTSDGKRFLEITVADVNKNAKYYSFYPEKLTIPASPATSDNSTAVATTAFVNNFFNTAGRVTGKCVPNYAAKIQVSLPYTASSYGILYISIKLNESYWTGKINNSEISSDGGSNMQQNTVSYILSPGDTVAITSGQVISAYFIPFKGA